MVSKSHRVNLHETNNPAAFTDKMDPTEYNSSHELVDDTLKSDDEDQSKNQNPSSALNDKRQKNIHTNQRPVALSDEISTASERRAQLDEFLFKLGDSENKANPKHKLYKCHQCPSSFWLKGSLWRHLGTHISEMPFKCDLSQTIQKQNLTNQNRDLTSNISFECKFCPSTFAKKRDLICHNKNHTGQKFIRHKKVHTGEKPFKCEICLSAFSKRRDFLRHERMHTGERPFECDLCPSTFACADYLAKHKTTHRGDKPYRCEKCPSAFACRGSLMKHMKTHTGEKPFKCGNCPSAFARKSGLIRHLKTHTGEMPWKCDECPLTFAENGKLARHKRTHTKVLSVEKPIQCSSGWDQIECLHWHDKTQNGKKNFQPDLYLSAFAEEAKSKGDTETYTKEKSFECYYCPSSFVEKGDLKNHERSHTGEIPFQCDMRPLAFARKPILLQHKRTYTAEKLYKCAF